MVTATKRVRRRTRAARWMATATKRARATAARGMVTATRVVGNKMAMATKSAMVTNGNTMGNGHSKEGGGCSTVATMVMGMGMAQGTWPPALLVERGGSWW